MKAASNSFSLTVTVFSLRPLGNAVASYCHDGPAHLCYFLHPSACRGKRCGGVLLLIFDFRQVWVVLPNKVRPSGYACHFDVSGSNLREQRSI
jgi:hypothetical protein